MCPENAKVLIAEDSEDFRTYQKRAMEEAGHTVVMEVDDVQKGLSAIADAVKLEVNVALVDGRIPNDPEDGPKLVKALLQSIPDIKIVDVSAFGDAIEKADAKMPKSKFNSKGLGKLVTDL